MAAGVVSQQTPAGESTNGGKDAEVQLLLKALRGSGSLEAAARFGSILLKWAQEGRPYRGRVFCAASVEAAVRLLAAEAVAPAPAPPRGASEVSSAAAAAPRDAAPTTVPAHQGASRPGARVVSIKASHWPPTRTLEAAAQVVRSAGALPGSLAAGLPAGASACPRLLASLHALAAAGAEPSGGGGDVRIVGDGPEDKEAISEKPRSPCEFRDVSWICPGCCPDFS